MTYKVTITLGRISGEVNWSFREKVVALEEIDEVVRIIEVSKAVLPPTGCPNDTLARATTLDTAPSTK